MLGATLGELESALPEALLQRAEFLWERDKNGAAARYDAAIANLRATDCDAPKTSASASRLKRSLGARSTGLAHCRKPEWTKVLAALIDPPTTRSPCPAVATTEALARFDELTRDEVYTEPFRTLANRFVHDLASRHGSRFAVHARVEIYAQLAVWYIDSAVRTSRYALHVVAGSAAPSRTAWIARFANAERLQHPWLDVAREFPVLLRLLFEGLGGASTALDELFLRLDTDREALHTTLGLATGTTLVSLAMGLSDPHRNGRTVARLTFNDGHAVIYKPKPIDIERAFNRFVRERNVSGLDSLIVLPRTGYGWVEAAAANTEGNALTANPEAVGAATACFWLLNATDLHLENVVVGERGITALDLETLLAAPVAGTEGGVGHKWRRHSVNATLLVNAQVGDGRHRANISGFDPAPEHVPRAPRVRFLRQGGEIGIALEPVPDPHIPGLPARAPGGDAGDVFRTVHAFRAALAGGSLRALLTTFVHELEERCVLRFVPRETAFYARLLERLSQPRLLRDGAALSLDLLALHDGVPREAPDQAVLHRIVDDEIRQLLRGDIPYFSGTAGGTALVLSCGTIEGFFGASGKAHALAKLAGHEPSDIDEQSALLATALGDRHAFSRSTTAGKFRMSRATPEARLAVLAQHIIDDAFVPRETPARWLSLYGDVSAESLRAEAGDTAFFGGSWGIVLALQGAETALDERTDTRFLQCFLDDQAPRLTRFSQRDAFAAVAPTLGFAGSGGELFALATLISLAPRRWQPLSARIGRLLDDAAERIASDDWLDVIGGSAGLALGCAQVLHLGPSEWATRAQAVQDGAARRLLDCAQSVDGALAWPVPGEQAPLLGYAHGWAGIVTALRATADLSADASLRQVLVEHLQRAAAYPALCHRRDGLWLDYRLGHGLTRRELPRPLDTSWCNGVPGLLRGLLALPGPMPTALEGAARGLFEDAVAALGNTGAFRLCCGEMGDVDVLLDIARVMGDPELLERSAARAHGIVDDVVSLLDQQAESELPELVFPGLFQGLGGMLYGGARAFHPDLPSLSGQHLKAVPKCWLLRPSNDLD